MANSLASWSNFYVITGSSAAALTGLMFVVITLVAGQERYRQNMRDGVETFSSPTVVHFCAALLLSAIMAAPWRGAIAPAVLVGLTGVYGAVYALRVVRRMIRANERATYLAEIDDWFWYAIMPLLAYLAVLAAGILLTVVAGDALFILAACTILLIFVGIRNAWDTVTYIAIEQINEIGKAPGEPRD